MDAKQFQLLASRLVEHGAYPAEFRSAISRSYYAAFHVGLEFLNEMGLSIKDNALAHNEVYWHFNNSGDEDLKKIGTKIGELRTKRNHADYKLKRTDVETKENAKLHVLSAERIIESIKKCSQVKDRKLIIENIQDLKNKIDNASKKQLIEKQ